MPGNKQPAEAQTVVAVLETDGPMKGSTLQQRTRMEILRLWQTCNVSNRIQLLCYGQRYLRLDREVAGYARLSPSIRREFQTYTLVYLPEQHAAAKVLAEQLRREITRTSQNKMDLARQTIALIVDSLPMQDILREHGCFIIAGDVAENMAHTVDRPESSTGRMVRGSDLDIIAVLEDGLPQDHFTRLDDVIFKRKHYLLVHPDFREEIDYLIKPLSKIEQQIQFNTFEDQVACKILHEGELLYGSPFVFQQVKEMLQHRDIAARLAKMEQRAIRFRARAEAALQHVDPDRYDGEMLNLFFTREEGDEIY